VRLTRDETFSLRDVLIIAMRRKKMVSAAASRLLVFVVTILEVQASSSPHDGCSDVLSERAGQVAGVYSFYRLQLRSLLPPLDFLRLSSTSFDVQQCKMKHPLVL
jgi:hypothetical protein